jgi:hypothetical protein
MPAEHLVVSLKPYHFFESNPSGDVKVSTQDFNQSKLYQAGLHRQGNREVEEEAAANGIANGHTSEFFVANLSRPHSNSSASDGHTNGTNGHANGTNGTNGCCH